jgi:hypothetical protein
MAQIDADKEVSFVVSSPWLGGVSPARPAMRGRPRIDKRIYYYKDRVVRVPIAFRLDPFFSIFSRADVGDGASFSDIVARASSSVRERAPNFFAARARSVVTVE